MLLKQAYKTVPFYHESFKKTGFKPEDLRRLEDVEKIPILKKTVIRNRLTEMLAHGYPRKDLLAHKTSGTTASPMNFYRSKSDISWGVAAELRGYGWAGYEVGDKIGVVWQVPPEQKRSIRMRLKRFFERRKTLNASVISESLMLDFARRMHGFKPDFLRGYVSSTNLFATFLDRNRQFTVQPKAVFTTGENLRPHYRKNIEGVFNCQVHDYYACNEMSHIALQCGNHEGLHVSDENILLETVKDGEHAAIGEEGRILVTNLHSHAMPFIRYEIDDFGTLLPDECPCGRKLSLVKPHGRQYEIFAGSRGNFTYLRDAQFVLRDIPIQDFQIVQESLDEIIVKIAKKPGYNETHTKFLVENLRCHGPARISVHFVDSIVPEKTGKTRHIISRIKTEYIRNMVDPVNA